jgi:DNA-binding PadR family transcriptional regulator
MSRPFTPKDYLILDLLAGQKQPKSAMAIAKELFGVPNGQLVAGSIRVLEDCGFTTSQVDGIAGLRRYVISRKGRQALKQR